MVRHGRRRSRQGEANEPNGAGAGAAAGRGARGARARTVPVAPLRRGQKRLRGSHPPRSLFVRRPLLFRQNQLRVRRCARSAELYRVAAELREEDFQSPLLLGLSLRALGRKDAAQEAERTGILRAERALARDPFNGRALSLAAGTLFESGDVERAMAWSRRSLELHPDDASALVNAACLQTMAGREEAALDLLERVFAQGCGKRDWVANDPDYAPLRDDPRFQRLVAKLD